MSILALFGSLIKAFDASETKRELGMTQFCEINYWLGLLAMIWILRFADSHDFCLTSHQGVLFADRFRQRAYFA